MRTRLLAISSLFICLSLFELHGEWQRAPMMTGQNLNSVIFLDSLFLAIGDSGVILSSTDGENWVFEESGTTRNLHHISGYDSLIIIGGDSGTIVSSIHRNPWNMMQLQDSAKISRVAVGPKAALAWRANRNSLWRRGPDNNWTFGHAGGLVNGLVWERNRFVGLGGNLISLSSDGIFWTGETVNTANVTDLAVDNDTFFASNMYGGIYRLQPAFPNNDEFWNRTLIGTLGKIPFNSSFKGIDACNGSRLVVGDSGLAISFRSSDSLYIETTNTAIDLNDAALGTYASVIVGDSGLILYQEAPQTAAKRKRSAAPQWSGNSRLPAFTNRQIRLPSAGSWEISIHQLNGRLLLRRRVTVSEACKTDISVPISSSLLYSLKKTPNE